MFVELEGVIIDVIEVLGAAGRVSGSLVTVVGDIECLVPLGTAWWSIWAISTIWAHGELALGEIDDIGFLGTAESGCESFVAVVMEVGRFWVICVRGIPTMTHSPNWDSDTLGSKVTHWVV